jgi:hypothetical protein
MEYFNPDQDSTLRSFILAVTSPDSSVVYYGVVEGMQKPSL